MIGRYDLYWTWQRRARAHGLAMSAHQPRGLHWSLSDNVPLQERTKRQSVGQWLGRAIHKIVIVID